MASCLLSLVWSSLVFPALVAGLTGETDIRTFFPKGADIDAGMEEEAFSEYGRDTLFDYIDGGAEVYLALGFRKVVAREYSLTLEEETYFTVDVYDMTEGVNAFGIFSQERYGDTPSVQVGVEGVMGGGALSYYAGPYYVKIRADAEGKAVDAILMKIARAVAKGIGDPGAAPVELRLFPDPNRVKGLEKYTGAGLLGLSSLKGFSCVYRRDKDELTLYLCPFENEKTSMAAEKAFIQRMKTPPKPDPEGRGFWFDDRYVGQGRVMRVGSYLAVAKGYAGAEKKDAWREEVCGLFFDKVIEAAVEKKTDNALKALMGGAQEEHE